MNRVPIYRFLLPDFELRASFRNGLTCRVVYGMSEGLNPAIRRAGECSALGDDLRPLKRPQNVKSNERNLDTTNRRRTGRTEGRRFNRDPRQFKDAFQFQPAQRLHPEFFYIRQVKYVGKSPDGPSIMVLQDGDDTPIDVARSEVGKFIPI
jgi:hypothetical protein